MASLAGVKIKRRQIPLPPSKKLNSMLLLVALIARIKRYNLVRFIAIRIHGFLVVYTIFRDVVRSAVKPNLPAVCRQLRNNVAHFGHNRSDTCLACIQFAVFTGNLVNCRPIVLCYRLVINTFFFIILFPVYHDGFCVIGQAFYLGADGRINYGILAAVVLVIKTIAIIILVVAPIKRITAIGQCPKTKSQPWVVQAAIVTAVEKPAVMITPAVMSIPAAVTINTCAIVSANIWPYSGTPGYSCPNVS